MRKIAVIGAGQAGLQLAIALVRQHYDVTLYSDRTPEEIQSGTILSNQGMFDGALQNERALGLNFWDDVCPNNQAVTFSLAQDGEKILSWKASTNKPFLSIDQRMKFPRWMQVFEQLGGNLHIQKVSVDDLPAIASAHDLTIISTGKKELSSIFEIDNEKTIFDEPMRKLGCLYVTNVISGQQPGLRANVLPGIGEFFVMSGLTHNGPCEMILFEGMPDKAFDCWKDLTHPEHYLEKTKDLLRTFLPWEAQRYEDAQLTDEKAVLKGCYTPLVRYPICKLENNQLILGMGDTVVLNDPIAGQGANNASKCAAIYFNRIVERGSQAFNSDWMQATFNSFWESTGQWATLLSNSYLLPPSKSMVKLLKRATTDKEVAHQLANAFDNPKSFFEYREVCHD